MNYPTQIASAEARRSSIERIVSKQNLLSFELFEQVRELRRVGCNEFCLNVAGFAWDLLVELYFSDSTDASTAATQLKDEAVY